VREQRKLARALRLLLNNLPALIEYVDGGLIGLAYILAETTKYQVTKRNGKANGLDRTAQLREFDNLKDAIKEQTVATRELRNAIKEMT